jgi:hypothetical protein
VEPEIGILSYSMEQGKGTRDDRSKERGLGGM